MKEFWTFCKYLTFALAPCSILFVSNIWGYLCVYSFAVLLAAAVFAMERKLLKLALADISYCRILEKSKPWQDVVLILALACSGAALICEGIIAGWVLGGILLAQSIAFAALTYALFRKKKQLK